MTRGATLGVDIGTSSSKGVLVGDDGAIIAGAVREHEVERPAPGHVEMDGRIWWREFVELARELTGAHPDVAVTAVGVSGMGPCVLLTTRDGEPVRPGILYGVDTRAGDEIAAIEAELGPETVTRVGGSSLTSQAAGPKIAWVRAHEPEAYARAERLFMPASWLAWHLTGAYVLDHHSASQATPLYDIEANAWVDDWAARIAPGIELPALAWAGDIAGTVSEAAAAETGLPAGIPVIAGTIDAWSEAASVGALEPGDLMLMYGTTMFLVATTDGALRTPSMWTTAGLRPGASCLAGGMATSGALTAWLRELTGGADYPALLAEAEASGPGARGIQMLPYFAGERTPIQDPDARGVIAGLTLSHTRGDLYRAALEATAYGVRHNIETMRAAGADIRRIVAVGGGTQGRLWTQIVSDLTGMPQQLARSSIGASYGAAWLAAAARAEDAGESAPRIADWNPIESLVEPDPARRADADAGYRRHLELYAGTADVVHDLAARQRAASAPSEGAP